MKDGPGLYCLYKDGGSKNFEADEVAAAEKDGWKDVPQIATQQEAAHPKAVNPQKKIVESQR